MTELTLIEHTEVKILKLIRNSLEVGNTPEKIRNSLHALLTQYTEEVIQKDETSPHGADVVQCSCHHEMYPHKRAEDRNKLRAEQRTRAGLSHGEKETDA